MSRHNGKSSAGVESPPKKLKRKEFEKSLEKLHVELVKL